MTDPTETKTRAPARGVRQITLFDRQTPTDQSTETVTFEKKGDLLIAGRDLGETPKKFFGSPEYEYWRRIDKHDVPRVLLGLIQDRFDSHASFKKWLEANGIDSEFHSWNS